MHYQKYKIIIFFLFIFFQVKAQEQRFAGFIGNSKGEGIPYASVYFNNNLLAISNEAGRFMISVNKRETVDTLYVTCIGYIATFAPLIQSGLQKIVLKESEQSLNEVSVNALNFTDQLLQDCLKKGVDTTEVSGTLFCRQYLKLDRIYKRFSEGVFNFRLDDMPNKLVYLDLINARALDNLQVKNQGLRKLRYGINIRAAVQQPFYLFKNTITSKVFNFKLIEKAYIDGISCYKIIFNLDQKVNVSKNAKFLIGGGVIYITCEGHLLKSLERNLLSPDFKKRWFTKEIYDITKGWPQLNHIELTSEIITGWSAERQPVGGLSINLKSNPKIQIVNSFSDAKDNQDLFNHLKGYNINFWKEYYILFGLHFPDDVFSTFSKFGDLDLQFTRGAALRN